MKKISIFLLVFISSLVLLGQSSLPKYTWANQQLARMTLEEKIAQLLIIRIHSNYDETYNAKMVADIQHYQPGAVCFFQGGPFREINLTNRIQEVSRIPILVTMDAEWGPSMRLDSMPRFPRNMTLGALLPQYDSLIYEMGKEIGRECKMLGIHVNYAPVVDVNNNSKNPVINSRSFGENKEWVVRKGLAYMQGLQSEQIVPCAKHFPGHGDTEVDSHLGLPIITKSKEALAETEFYPFTKMIAQNVEMIMVSHLNIPALDSSQNSIATLSYPIVTGLLKKEMGYNGIIVSDGMEMDGLRKFYKNGAEAEIKCLLAGVDLLCLPNDMNIIIPEIKKAVENGIISEKEINEKCLKILKLKEDLGLTTFTPISIDSGKIFDFTRANDLIKTIETKALTLVTNQGIIPISNQTNCAVVIIGDQETTPFCEQICKDRSLKYILVNKELTNYESQKAISSLNAYSTVIVVYIGTNQAPAKQYGITSQSVRFIHELKKSKKVILTLFGNPYALEQFNDLNQFSAIVVGYQRTATSVSSTFDGLFGKIRFEGVLPVTTSKYKSRTNYYTPVPISLNQNIPAPVENNLAPNINTTVQSSTNGVPSVNSNMISATTVRDIDSIVQNGINTQCFPGCQVLVLKKGKILFSKNYGYLKYDQKVPVESNTLYDIASITKIAGTTMAVMKLYDQKKIGLKNLVEDYLPFFKNSEVGKITIDELLTHTSGLPAFIPFYRKLESDSLRYIYINDIQNETFTEQIAKELYLNKEYKTVMLQQIKDCKLDRKNYTYSDIGFVLLKEIVESITKQSIDQYLAEQFYTPMEMKNTCFNPMNHGYKLDQIAPTENDSFFRMQTIQGYVHDQTAALFGGVCGNAGIFSTAEDLGKLLTMILQKGIYKGNRYLSEETVDLFNSPYPLHQCKTRGLGFYTPNNPDPSEILPKQASNKTFGHQGFTGTVCWVDPKEELIYIFLSNRVYPTVEPNNLVKSKIRLILHEKIYEALK
ncbi:MAG TPA: glycoside hydrolase family 3 N-terminal domain-containing protein [Bacteroidales bacterium]|nr:glycoside hydrolase family 3 N-terminal domain-containing protein [Bacteroidales bacterium]